MLELPPDLWMPDKKGRNHKTVNKFRLAAESFAAQVILPWFLTILGAMALVILSLVVGKDYYVEPTGWGLLAVILRPGY